MSQKSHNARVTKTNERKRVEHWLLKNQNYINITAIEKKISAPKGLIQKFIKYDKIIHDKWIAPLHELLKSITSFGLR